MLSSNSTELQHGRVQIPAELTSQIIISALDIALEISGQQYYFTSKKLALISRDICRLILRHTDDCFTRHMLLAHAANREATAHRRERHARRSQWGKPLCAQCRVLADINRAERERFNLLGTALCDLPRFPELAPQPHKNEATSSAQGVKDAPTRREGEVIESATMECGLVEVRTGTLDVESGETRFGPGVTYYRDGVNVWSLFDRGDCMIVPLPKLRNSVS